MSDTIKHIQEFIDKLESQKTEINEELIKLGSYKDFKLNQEYKNSLNLEYSQLCSDILELQKKITRVRHKLDMYTDGLYKYERYKLLKETLENIENNIELFEEVLKHEEERVKNTGI